MQLRVRLDRQLRNVCLIFRVLRLLAKPLHPLDPLCTPWNPWNIQLSQGTGQGVSMTFNAASRLRSLEKDRSEALGSSRCELPGMHGVPKSAVLPYASGVGGEPEALKLEMYNCTTVWYHICVWPRSAKFWASVRMNLAESDMPPAAYQK